MLTYNQFAWSKKLIANWMGKDPFANAWKYGCGLFFPIICFSVHNTRWNQHLSSKCSWWHKSNGCRRRQDSDSHLINEKVFRYLLKNFFVEAAEHMLQNGLSFHFNTLGDSGATTDLHRDFPESCDLIILHEVAALN